jgi:uncharacterized protein DUF6292
MTASKLPDKLSQNLGDPAGQRREDRDRARRLLTDYLDQVAAALHREGLRVTGRRISTSPALEASLTTVPGRILAPAAPAAVELAWAEDTGWSISHRLIGTTATPWRYLHLDLLPSPDAVAQFAVAVISNEDDCGMPYPAQFRFRSQPLRPVLETLARFRPIAPGVGVASAAQSVAARSPNR